MIHIQLVDETTFEAVLDLEVDPKDQRRVASNSYSLAQAWLYRNQGTILPYAVMTSKTVVGFLLLEKNKENGEYYLWRLMIDHRFQHQGYGREALRQVLEQGNKDPSCHQIRVNYVIGNHKMRALLDSLGFEAAGLAANEVAMIYQTH